MLFRSIISYPLPFFELPFDLFDFELRLGFELLLDFLAFELLPDFLEELLEAFGLEDLDELFLLEEEDLLLGFLDLVALDLEFFELLWLLTFELDRLGLVEVFCLTLPPAFAFGVLVDFVAPELYRSGLLGRVVGVRVRSLPVEAVGD